jgi:hypothetical protein
LTPELEAIKDALIVRNFIAYAETVRYHVNIIRTNHQQRVVMVTRNGKVLQETVFDGPKRTPAHMEMYRLREIFNCDMEE